MMLFFTPNHNFYLQKLNDRYEVCFSLGVTYCQTALEFMDLSNSCPGMTITQKVEYLSPRWVTIVEPKNIEELIKCILFQEAAE